jgi:hypothetical protein
MSPVKLKGVPPITPHFLMLKIQTHRNRGKILRHELKPSTTQDYTIHRAKEYLVASQDMPMVK